VKRIELFRPVNVPIWYEVVGARTKGPWQQWQLALIAVANDDGSRRPIRFQG
jgi:hypothetical protein